MTPNLNNNKVFLEGGGGWRGWDGGGARVNVIFLLGIQIWWRWGGGGLELVIFFTMNPNLQI